MQADAGPADHQVSPSVTEARPTIGSAARAGPVSSRRTARAVRISAGRQFVPIGERAS